MRNKPSTLHAIIRTSPKGEGQEFIGTCMNCGAENLTFADMNKYCENITGRTNDENIIAAIDGGN